MLLTFVSIVRATIDLSSICRLHTEMIRNIDSIIHQLCSDILIQQLEINTFLQWLIRSRIEYIVYDLVKEGFLINITVAYNLLK